MARRVDAVTIKILMGEIPLFDQLTHVQKEHLAEFIQYAFYKSNKAIFTEGEKGETLYYIISGRVEVIKDSLSGEKTVLAKYRKGVTIGEMSLVDNSTRSATVRATEDTEMLYLTRENFEKILGLYPQTGIRVLKNIAAHLSLRLRDASGKLADLSAYTKFDDIGRHEIPDDYTDSIKVNRRRS
jgi:CRP-like cAMP-binding protein